jgi:TRAP-type C4-dicarboxylate transport system substrate-binding protein
MSQIALARVGADLGHIQAAAKEAGQLQRELSNKAADETLAAFKANSAIAVNDVDRAAFVEATKPVAEAWKSKDVGPFVEELIAAAKA